MAETVSKDQVPKPLALQTIWGEKVPPLDFVLPGLVRGTVGVLVAAGGTGKSFLMLATALGIGIGRDVAEIWGSDPKQGNVTFLCLEDVEDELKRRLQLVGKDFKKRECREAERTVRLIPAAGGGRSIAQQIRAGGIEESAFFANLRREVEESKARLLVIDTFNRFLGGLSENDGQHMAWVLDRLEQLAESAGCAIVLCHHASKSAQASGSSHQAHAARGSSVITDNARWQCNLSVPQRRDLFKDAKDEERRKYVYLEFAKLNYGEAQPRRLLTKREGGSIHWVTGNDPPRRDSPAASKKPQLAVISRDFTFPDIADAKPSYPR